MKALAEYMDTWYGRLFRASVATGISVISAKSGNSWIYILVGPILQAGSKFLRDKYPDSFLEALPV